MQIPFFPLVKKDLTFIHYGNDSRVEGLVNFDKLRMIAKEVHQLNNLASGVLPVSLNCVENDSLIAGDCISCTEASLDCRSKGRCLRVYKCFVTFAEFSCVLSKFLGRIHEPLDVCSRDDEAQEVDRSRSEPQEDVRRCEFSRVLLSTMQLGCCRMKTFPFYNIINDNCVAI